MLLRRTSYEAEGGGDYEVLHLKIDTEDGHAEGVEVTVTGLPGGYPAIDAAGFLFLQVRKKANRLETDVNFDYQDAFAP